MIKMFFVIIGCFFLTGCAAGNTVVYKSDAQGRWVKTVYSKSYISDKIELADGLFVVITGYDEGKVNPIAQAFGALGPEAETPPASFVAHFKNTSNGSLSVGLQSLEVAGVIHTLEPKMMFLDPQEIKSTKKIMGSCYLGSQSIKTKLMFVYQAQTILKEITLNQETMKAFQDRMKRNARAQKVN